MKRLLLLSLTCLISQAAFARLTVGTYNIRNFDYDERARISTDKPALESLLKSLNFDLLGVNEINNVPEFTRFIARRMPGYAVALSDCGGAHGQKLGFVYRTSKLRLVRFDEEMVFSGEGSTGGCNTGSRPAAVAQFEEVDTREKFHAIQVHFKSGGAADSIAKRANQYALLQQLFKELGDLGNRNIVAMGDFNTTGYLDRDADYRNFTGMLRAANLTDLSANIGCSAYWWGGSDDGIETPSLLDHVIATPGMLKNQTSARATVGGHCRAVSCRAATPAQLGVSYTGVSDHCPQTATIR